MRSGSSPRRWRRRSSARSSPVPPGAPGRRGRRPGHDRRGGVAGRPAGGRRGLRAGRLPGLRDARRRPGHRRAGPGGAGVEQAARPRRRRRGRVQRRAARRSTSSTTSWRTWSRATIDDTPGGGGGPGRAAGQDPRPRHRPAPGHARRRCPATSTPRTTAPTPVDIRPTVLASAGDGTFSAMNFNGRLYVLLVGGTQPRGPHRPREGGAAAERRVELRRHPDRHRGRPRHHRPRPPGARGAPTCRRPTRPSARGLAALAGSQQPDGSWLSFGVADPNSTALAVLGIRATGGDPNTPCWREALDDAWAGRALRRPGRLAARRAGRRRSHRVAGRRVRRDHVRHQPGGAGDPRAQPALRRRSRRAPAVRRRRRRGAVRPRRLRRPARPAGRRRRATAYQAEPPARRGVRGVGRSAR